MERLQPILKQKFWILLGVAILMTLIGWWMATSTMLKAITERTAEINKSFEKVPKGTIPNELWAKKLNDLNTSQEKAIATTQAVLWQKQLAKMMVWPDGVEVQNGYWGKLSNESREQFRISYAKEVQHVWKTLRPLDPEENDDTGIVNYPFVNMYSVLKRQPWRGIGVDSDALWEVREDLWLLERLFQSITAVNGGSDSNRNDAYIHQIDRLELRGGGAAPAKAAAAKKPAATNAPAVAPMIVPEVVGGGTGGPLPVISAEFDPVEEFGDDGSSATGGGGATGPLGRGPGKEAAAPKPISRYIEKTKDEKKPFKLRGFYLSLKMDHTRIPALISELTSLEGSVLPVEVLRVQMSRLHEDVPSGAAPGAPVANQVAAGGGGGGGSGMGSRGGRGKKDRGEIDEDVGGRAFIPANTNAIKGADNIPRNAKATLEKALNDPIMAQVTICGVFILYQKPDPAMVSIAEPTPTATPTSTPASPPTAAANPSTSTAEEANAAETASTTDEQPAAEGEDQPATTTTDAEMPGESEPSNTGPPDDSPTKPENEEKSP